jgi:hypothetical protein
MLITFLQLLVKLLLFALLFCIEISVAIPVISLVFLSLIAQSERPWVQVTMLVCSSLLASSFLGVAWSLVALLFALFWFTARELSKLRWHAQTVTVVTSWVLAVILTGFANLDINYKTVLYTLLFTVVAFGLSRAFLPKKMRHTVIDWISPTKV